MSIIIEGLRNTGHGFALQIAKNMAAMWIKTNHEGFVKFNRMFGKVKNSSHFFIDTKNMIFRWSSIFFFSHVWWQYNALRLGDELLFRDERKPFDGPIGYATTNGFLLTLLDYYGEEVNADDYHDFQSPSIFGHPMGMSIENFPFTGE